MTVPRLQAWSQFADRLEDLARPEKIEAALSCLNLLVTDALRHVPDVIAYLSRLRNQSVFNFCAIPQVLSHLSLHIISFHLYILDLPTVHHNALITPPLLQCIFFFFFLHLNPCNTSLVQVMAIATLSSCYNNPMVFQGVVKIRKGQAVTLMMEATNMPAVQTIIAQYSQEVSVLLKSISQLLRWGELRNAKVCSGSF